MTPPRSGSSDSHGDARRDEQDNKHAITVGMPGATKIVQIDVPPGQPVPWQAGEKHAVVGVRTPRMDAVAKVTGRAKFTYDINLPGMLYAKFVRSPYARAKVKSVDAAAAAAMPGVKAARAYGNGDVRYAGGFVGLVLATSRQGAIEAARAVKVEYEILPHAARLDQALAPDAPLVKKNGPNKSPGGRESTPKELEEIGGLLQSAAKTVSAICTTQVQTHTCLESHGVVAHWEAPDRLKVWASTQATFGVRNELAGAFKLPESSVQVICHYIGGGFGSKFSLGYFGRTAADLAKEFNAPVKLMLDRREEHVDGGNRPDSIQDMTLGVSPAGALVAYKVDITGTGGLNGGPGVANPIIYNFGRVAKTSSAVATNAGAAAAFRAPGHPPGSFAVETMMDLAAEAIGMDPLELRLKNDHMPIRQRQYKEGAKLIGWDKRKANGSDKGPIKHGLGVAAATWGGRGGPQAEVLCRIRRDGSVEVRNGAQDIGTGTRTIMAMVAAEELGIPLSRVTPFMGDTNDPIGPGSGGSTTAPSIMPAARHAAFLAGTKVRELIAASWKCGASDLELKDGHVVHAKDASKKMAWNAACALIEGDELSALGTRSANFKQGETYEMGVGGVHFAEVEVDTETGRVRVTRYVAMQDAGTIVNPLLAESQVNGAVIQGISYALFEERHLDRHFGQQLNADMDMYKIAGTRDMPEITVVLTDVVNGGNNVGLMGLGEGPAVPIAACIANAVHNAIGVRVLSLPMTPDRVLAALAPKEHKK